MRKTTHTRGACRRKTAAAVPERKTMEEHPVRKKSALITGASRGIGRAAALAFAQNGYHLYLTCRSRMDLLSSLADEITAAYPVSCRIFSCDAGDFASVQAVFAELDELTVLVNNAALSYVGLLSEMPPQEWERLMRVNVSGVFYHCKCAIPLFLRQGYGRILNVSSVWGSAGASMETAYSASKGAVNALTRALAKELAPSNIPVNAAAFGMIDTEMNRHLSPEEKEAIRREIPADRFASPEEAAAFLCHLAQASPYLTGQIIAFDGGWQ